MVSGTRFVEAVFHQQGGEDGAHLLEAQRNFFAFFFASIGDDGEVRGVNFKPRRRLCRGRCRGSQKAPRSIVGSSEVGMGRVRAMRVPPRNVTTKCYHVAGQGNRRKRGGAELLLGRSEVAHQFGLAGIGTRACSGDI